MARKRSVPIIATREPPELSLKLTAEALLREKRFEEAEKAYRHLLMRAPDDVRALLNYGGVLIEFCRFDEAEALLVRAVTLDPQRWRAWSNLGIVMLEQQRYSDAIAAFSNAIRINPSYAAALSGLGVTLQRCGLAAESLTFLDLAVSIAPEQAEIRHNRALSLLSSGDYLRGFAEYEWRWRMPEKSLLAIDAPRWSGEPFHGRTLLVYDEEGLGDILQFARYLPAVKARGGHLVLRAPASLVTLLSRLPGVDKVISRDEKTPPFDLACPIMSLPQVFGSTADTIPSPGGYLSPDPAILDAWSTRLASDEARLGTSSFRIGLVWAGGARPWHRGVSLWDRRRSTTLQTLAPLAQAAPGVVFYSLQIGDAGKEAASPPAGMELIDHTHHIRTFDDTAGLVSHLDLVIAVDTSTAHLAAALGRPVWLLSRYDQCWRWRVGGDRSPWYETIRLYVQPAPFDWAFPIRRMVEDLSSLARTARPSAMCSRATRAVRSHDLTVAG